MSNKDLIASVKEALERTEIMALSTSGTDGSWVCPVRFSYDKNLNLTFTSMLDTKHVQNILKDPGVAVAIYSWPGPAGGNLGLQIKGTAQHDSGDPNGWNEFTIVPEEAWCFDSRIDRTRKRIDLSKLDLTV